MDLATWTNVLGLEGLEVVAAERGEGGKGWRLAVVSTSTVGLCPHCKKPTSTRHMVKWQSIRDLPVAGRVLLLEVQAPQFDCEPCGKRFTVHPSCILEGTHVTLRLAEAIADCVNVSTLSAAAATYRLPESTVKVIFEKIIERRRAEKARVLKPMTKLGIDEIHLKVHDDPAKPPESPPGTPPATEPPTSGEAGEKIIRD
jgi:transposase